jgi:hypothetical protein
MPPRRSVTTAHARRAGLARFLTLSQSPEKGRPRGAWPASPFSFRGSAAIAAVIPVRMRIDSEHAVDASNDSTSRSTNNPTNKATDRSEYAVTGIGTAMCPVVHPTRHALRLCPKNIPAIEATADRPPRFALGAIMPVRHVTAPSQPGFGNTKRKIVRIRITDDEDKSLHLRGRRA